MPSERQDTSPPAPEPLGDFEAFAHRAWDEHAIYVYREPNLPETVRVLARSLRVGHAPGAVAIRPEVPMDEARAAVTRLAEEGDAAWTERAAQATTGALEGDIGNVIAVRVEEGRMSPALKAGEMAIIDRDRPPEPGNVCLFVSQGVGWLRRLVDVDHAAGRWRFVADGGDRTAVTFAAPEIIGVVVAVQPRGRGKP